MVKTMQNRKYPLEVIAAWFQALNVDFVAAAQAAGADAAKVVQAFQDCKARAKTNFRKLAFELHPDRQGGDEARFKELAGIWNRLKDIEISLQPPQPQPQRVSVTIVSIRHPIPNPYYSNSSTGTTTNGSWWV
jgi:hypothetical protein